MTNRFQMSRARRSISTCVEPLIDSTLRIAGGCQMMRQQFGLALDDVGEILLQHRRDTSM
jgi:hypothetical protein